MFIQLRDNQLVRHGRSLRLRGFNLGNWLLHEAYMIGLPWTGHEMRRQFRRTLGEEKFRAFFGPLLDDYVTEADMAFLAAQGFNLLQVPFDYRHFATDHSCAGFDNDGERHFDRLIALARKHDIALILGMHALPGALVRDWNAESNYGEALFWEHDFFLDQTAAIWDRIARRYAHEPVILGYELLSEPLAPDLAQFRCVHARLIETVRAVDKDHILFLSGDRWNQDIASLGDEPFVDAQVMPSLHFYAVNAQPFKLLKDYPGEHGGKPVNRDTVRTAFAARHDQRPVNRLTLLGEFGMTRPVPELVISEKLAFGAQLRINADLLEYAEELGLPWTMWAYKDLGVLGLVSPGPNTPWRQFLARSDVRAINHGFYGKMAPALEALVQQHLPAATPDERFQFTYGSRHHWDAMTLPHLIRKLGEYSAADLTLMARSWQFNECSVDEERLAVLQGCFRR